MTHQLGNNSLPVIDLSPLGSPTGEAAVAAAINAACTGPGFFYVRNHGVPDATIAAAMAAAPLLPAAASEGAHQGQFDPPRLARAAARDGGAKKPDLKNSSPSGSICRRTRNGAGGEKLRAQQLAGGRAELAPAMEAYFAAIGACGAKLLRAVALSLGLDRDFFAPHYRLPLQRTQAIFYPPQAPDDMDGFGVAPHTDFGCITLLWQDDSGGLEVRERQTGAWIPAPPLPGTLVVNVGDLLGRWSNDRFASTPHRVVNRSGHERMSIATFYDPDFSAPVDPRALGATDPHYPPTTCGEHILGRFAQAFAYRKKG